MWKHKTKWLVRGGRKVRCYLCGKKILAKGDLFLFHQDTGYYSHQSCLAENTTISGNERRKAVKKIAVGAAVVGAIAAGAGKLIDISSQSKGLNSPAAQTILTSQGLIPPALTSDPANPVPGQMWYRSDAGVMAHFDAVQNRVVYSSEINDGNVNVTSKGIINGLSVLPNDGKGGFGPDTMLGATAPGQYGSPHTKSAGIGEGWNYAIETATEDVVGLWFMSPVKILSGMFVVTEPTTLPTVNSTGHTIMNPTLLGDSSMSPFIMSAHQGGYTLTIPMAGAVNYRIENIQPCTPSQFPYTPPGYSSPPTPDGLLNIDGSLNGVVDAASFEGYNIDISAGGWSETPLYLNGFGSITLYNFEGYGGGTTYGNAFLTAVVIIMDSSNFGANNPSITMGGYNITVNGTPYTIGANIFLTNCYSDNGAPVPPINIVDGGLGYMIQKPFVAPLYYNANLVSPTHGGWVELDGGGWTPTSDNNYSLFYFPAGTSGIIAMAFAKIRLSIGATSSTEPATLISGGGAYISYVNIEFEYIPLSGGNPQYFSLPFYGANPITLPNSLGAGTSGTTAGEVTQQVAKYDIYYKKIIFYFSGYENDTTTNQSINLWAPFSTISVITANTTGLTISATTSGITITSPDSTTTYSGIVIVEGY